MNDVLIELLDAIEEEFGVYIDYRAFTRIFNEYGLMIVPIEDPTNLRFADE